MLQTILTPLCITLVCCGIIFLYFKNRLSTTERKVDIMFELIQEHENQRKLMAQNYIVQSAGQEMEYHETSSIEPGLIDISDNEENTDSESESDSDSDDDGDRITLEENLDHVEGIKNVTLTLEGAEIGRNNMESEDSPKITEVDTEPLDKSEIKEIKLEDTNKDTKNKEEMELLDIELDDIELDDIELSGDDNMDDQEENQHVEPNDDVVVVEKLNEKPYDKWKVADLKSECASKGLTGYSSMKKKALIELLTESSAKQMTAN